MNFLLRIQYCTISFLFILSFYTAYSQEETQDPGLVVAAAADQGNVIRIMNNSALEDFAATLQNTRKFIFMGTERIKGEETLKKIAEVETPKTFEPFKNHLTEEDYQEFKELAGLSSDADVTAFLNRPGSISLVGFFTELKIDFLYAFGLGFLHKNVEKGKLYEYQVYREDLNGRQELWGSALIFAKEGNKELNRIKTEIQDITPTDSSLIFTWDVEIPLLEDLDIPELENIKRPGFLSGKSYTPQTNYDQLVPYINRYLLTDVNTKFAPFYRVNDQKDWIPAAKVLAGIDSVSGKHFVTYTINCLPNDVVESLIVPEDYVANRGPKSETALGVAAHKGSVDYIYDVQARDSVNSILLTWDKLPAQRYYTGIEVAKGWNEEEPTVVATLPATATSYIDNRVFPAGRLFTYYVRPLFIALNDLEQEVPAVVMHSCTTFSRPQIPYNLQVKTEGDLVKISWEGTEDPAFHSYHVLRGTSPQDLTLISPNVYQKEFADTLSYLSAKETYYYVVMAMNVTQDTSGYSDYISYVPEKPTEIVSPPHLAYELVNQAAYLSWDDVKLNDHFIAGYILQKKTEEGNFTTLHTGIWESNQFVDEHFEPGKTSYYRVASISIKGDTAAYSREMTAGGPLPEPGMEAVNGVQLTNLSKSIRVSWPGAINRSVSKYKVYKKLPTDPAFTLLKEVLPGHFETEDENVTRGQIYIYAVTAVNRNNQESEISEEKAIYRE